MPTRINADHVISHTKVMMIDSELVITGRFNCTQAAQEKNVEKALIIRGPALATPDTQHGDAHQRHRQPSVGRGVP